MNTAVNLDFTVHLEMLLKDNQDVYSLCLLTMEVLLTHVLHSFSFIFFLHDEVEVSIWCCSSQKFGGTTPRVNVVDVL